jgi:hypothetical protein
MAPFPCSVCVRLYPPATADTSNVVPASTVMRGISPSGEAGAMLRGSKLSTSSALAANVVANDEPRASVPPRIEKFPSNALAAPLSVVVPASYLTISALPLAAPP